MLDIFIISYLSLVLLASEADRLILVKENSLHKISIYSCLDQEQIEHFLVYTGICRKFSIKQDKQAG